MMRLKMIFRTFLSVLTLVSMMAGSVQAALLDVGPVVPQVNPSTENPINTGIGLGHGFPLWYRDTNRVPLQICTDRASGMCLTAEPNPAAALNFPNNISDELFWYTADAIIDYPQTGILQRPGQAILVMAIEAAFSTGDVVPGAQVSFARIRIRIDTPAVGTYLVTTPYKQFSFTVDAAALGDDGRRAINHTEDIGIAEGGVFTGALNGSIGPFLYCTNAPIVNAFGSFIGDPNVPCTALGSTFNPPSLPGPANYFRIQGPNGFDVQTNQFAISGKLYTDPIPTPLTVDKVTYARDASGVQVSSFATTQAMSNQVNSTLAFPQNFALTNAPSDLRVAVTGIPTQIMATNSPADGKFYDSTGRVALQGAVPAIATVTNVADTPDTVKTAPLVDEIKITNATYNPTTRVLTINAQTLDTIANPALTAYMPGMTDPLGTIAGGQLVVTFPITDNGGKTFNIPTETITVTSAIGGSSTAPVVTFLAVQPVATSGATITATPATPQNTGIPQVVFTATATGGTGTYEYAFQQRIAGVWTTVQNYGPTPYYIWNTSAQPGGTYFFQALARSAGSTRAFEAGQGIAYNLVPPAATGATITAAPASPQAAGIPQVVFNATGIGGSGTYEYKFQQKIAGVWTTVQDYSSTASYNWNSSAQPAGIYTFQVLVRSAGSTAAFESGKGILYTINP